MGTFGVQFTYEVGKILVAVVGSRLLVVEDTLEVVVHHSIVAFLLVVDTHWTEVVFELQSAEVALVVVYWNLRIQFYPEAEGFKPR